MIHFEVIDKHLSCSKQEENLFDRVALEIQKETNKHSIEKLFRLFRERCQIHDEMIVGRTAMELMNASSNC